MQDNPRRGIPLMIATTIIFAIQDDISRYLAGSYDIITIVAIRCWFCHNQVDSNKPQPPANHVCKLVVLYFWPRKYALLCSALAKRDW